MKAYKLTDKHALTRNGTTWGPKVTQTADGSGELCGPGWLHFYADPLLAVLLNPIHANFTEPRLWEAEAEGEIKEDHGLKFGCTKLATLCEIPLPQISTTQRVAFGILCAKQVCTNAEWVTWADNWLTNRNRMGAAAAAAWAAAAAAEAAERAAAERAAAERAAAERAAAWAAAAAAAAAEAAAKPLDLKALSREAMRIGLP